MAGQLELTTRFWEGKLLRNRGLFDVSTVTLMEHTVKYLKVLKDTGYVDPKDQPKGERK